jgi:hypothetical protein
MDGCGADGERDPTAGGTAQQRRQTLAIARGARLLNICGCHDNSPIILCSLRPGADERAEPLLILEM